MKIFQIKKSHSFLAVIVSFSIHAHSHADMCLNPFPALHVTPGLCCMETGDLNNDGKSDLLVSFLSENKKYKVIVFYNNDGKFGKNSSLELKSDFINPVKLAIGDFDNDGKNDIAVNESSKKLHLFLGNDNFSNAISNHNENTYSSSIYPAKINDGGNCDFISSGAFRKWMGANVWRNGYIHPPEKVLSHICIPWDLNNDGKTDIISLPKGKNQICLYYGPFTDMNITPFDVSEFKVLDFDNPIYAVPGNLNSDIRPDIAVSNMEKTAVFYQAKPTGFMENKASVTINCGGPLLTADFNGDKKDDLAVLDSRRQKIFIFLQQNNKFFPESSEKADFAIPIKKDACFCSGDIDGNGLIDLIVSDASGINIYFNKNK